MKCIFCRNVLGTLTLGEILSQRERIANEMQVEMDHQIIIIIIIIVVIIIIIIKELQTR